MLILHHLENSRSFRILWLLEELALAYELKTYARDPESGQAQADYKELHALGKAPLLIDDDNVLVESGAIIEYLLDTYGAGRLRPAIGTPERLRYNYWMHAAEGSIMNLLTLSLFLNRMDSRAPFFLKPFIRPVTGQVRRAYVRPNLGKTLAYIEQELGRSDWFAGDEFSAADIQMGYVMTALAARAGLGDDFPNCRRWQHQVEARPGYRRAMEKNGEMKLLGD